MVRAKRLILSIAVALIGAVFALPTPASACTPDPCPDPVRTFGDNGYVPGHLVRFLIVGAVDPTTLDLELRTAAGDPIPASMQSSGGDRYFAPDQPLGDGEVVLSYTRTCGVPALGVPAASTVEYAFRTFAPEPIEIEEPSIQLIEKGRSFIYPENAFERYAVSSGILNATVAGHLVQMWASVDGKPYRIDGSTLTLAADCTGTQRAGAVDSCGMGGWLAPGKHVVTLQSHLIGEAPRPSVELEIDLSCGPDACEPEPSLASSTVDDREATEAESDEPGTATTNGCAVTRGTRDASSAAISILGLLALALRFRRS